MIFVGYYTPQYRNEAQKLTSSLYKHHLPFCVQPVPDMGSWQKNTQYKPIFIQWMMAKYPEHSAIVYLDADSAVKQRPSILLDMPREVDFAAHYRNWRLNQHELLSGTLYFANREKVRATLMAWQEENDKNPDTWDQRTLQNVIERRAKDLVTEELPFSYCRVFDAKESKEKPVIEQYMASRRLKHQ